MSELTYPIGAEPLTITEAWMPTERQALTATVICQMLSDLLQPIYLFRYDRARQGIFIIAGDTESIEIVIAEDGRWRFEGG